MHGIIKKILACLWLYVTELFLELEIFQRKFVKNSKHFIYNIFFSKIVLFFRYCGKHSVQS